MLKKLKAVSADGTRIVQKTAAQFHVGERTMLADCKSGQSSRDDVTDEEFLEYQDLVERCAVERRNLDIANGSARHARILIRKLFEIAKFDVRLITGKLTEISDVDKVPLYSDHSVIDKAQVFLRRPGSRLSIIAVEGLIDNADNNIFLRRILQDKDRLGVVRVAIPKLADIADLGIPHGMVADGEAYRFETGADALNQKEPSAFTAIANFGNPENGLKIYSYFANLYRHLPDASISVYGEERAVTV